MKLLRTLPIALAVAWIMASDALAHEPTDKAPSAAASLSPAATEAARAVDAFHAALSMGNTRAALALLADDVLIFEAGGVERSKAEYASHHLAADAAFTQAVPGRTIRRTGAAVGDVAWIASEGRTTGRYKDKPVDRVTAETIILRRAGSGWLISHVHWSSAAAKP
jgi:ketosteroid isomerase-like protein